MTVYVDDLRTVKRSKMWPWLQSCHMFADTLDELHAMAEKVGMHPAWFQGHKELPHYDLTPNKRAQAVH